MVRPSSLSVGNAAARLNDYILRTFHIPLGEVYLLHLYGLNGHNGENQIALTGLQGVDQQVKVHAYNLKLHAKVFGDGFGHLNVYAGGLVVITHILEGGNVGLVSITSLPAFFNGVKRAASQPQAMPASEDTATEDACLGEAGAAELAAGAVPVQPAKTNSIAKARISAIFFMVKLSSFTQKNI
jgi:hypothetical protein